MATGELRNVWFHMHIRCEDEDYPQFKDYGGRGIMVCDEWAMYGPFHNWASTAGYEKGLFLDRIDNDGPYSPENCRFVTRRQNSRNKRNSVFISSFGENKTAVEWSEDSRCSVSYGTLMYRVRSGWDATDALLLSVEDGKRRAAAATTLKRKRNGHYRMYDLDGVGKTIAEWSRDSRCVVKKATLWQRVVKHNWQLEKAMTTPATPGRTKRVT